MDPVTALTIDKGQKNTRLLVQPQYSPMPVEQQIAVLYCGTHGLLKDVPLDKVREFEKALINNLQQTDVVPDAEKRHHRRRSEREDRGGRRCCRVRV